MNIGILGTQTIGHVIGKLLVEFAANLSDRVIALMAAGGIKGSSASREKAKRENKEKAPQNKPSAPKAPKKKPAKPKTTKAKTLKVEAQSAGEAAPKKPRSKKSEMSAETVLAEKVEPKEQKVNPAFIAESKETLLPALQRETVKYEAPQKVEKPVARNSAYTPSSFGASTRKKITSACCGLAAFFCLF